jgi:hypothetical protein
MKKKPLNDIKIQLNKVVFRDSGQGRAADTMYKFCSKRILL